MGETVNIGTMAEKLSQELFEVLGWKLTGTTNINWECCETDKHKLKTHPADAVWYYDDPYSNTRTYILADLKSYGKASITPKKIQDAIVSLSKAVACAEKSSKWKEKFLVDCARVNQVNGMLFVYNHDGEYDKDFGRLLKGVQTAEVLFLPQNRNLIVLGPKDICELNSIVTHIKTLGYDRSDPRILEKSFFFPELKLSRKMIPSGDQWNNAAPLSYLISKLIALKTREKGESGAYNDLHIYYRGKGTTTEEFLYLIEYIRRFQQMQTATGNIYVNFVSMESMEGVASLYERAKNEYSEVSGVKKEQLSKIKFTTLTNFSRRYCEDEIGMELRNDKR